MTPDGNHTPQCPADAIIELDALLNTRGTATPAAEASELARELPKRIVEVRMRDGTFHYLTLLWDIIRRHVPEKSAEDTRRSLDEIISRLAKQDGASMPTFDLESHRWKAVNVREIEEILPEGI